MSQHFPEDEIGLASMGDLVLEADRGASGAGAFVVKTANVERARIAADGTASGVFAGGGGSQPAWEAVTVPTDQASWSALDTAGTCLADIAPTLPLTVDGTNDQFLVQGNSPAPANETFTIPHGVYTTIAQTVAATAAAVGDDSGERFDTRVTPSDSSGKILLTTVAGQGGLYALFGEGNGGAAALGFTGNPNVFTGGFGGDWTFNTGVITAPPSGGSATIMATSDNFGQVWAVECELMVVDHTNYFAAFNAAAVLGDSGAQELDGIGFTANGNEPGIDANLYASQQVSDTGLADEDWHTLRIITLPIVRQVYFDGTLVGQMFGQAGTAQDPTDGYKESRFLLCDTIGGTAFRNLKAWRIPLPTFPA